MAGFFGQHRSCHDCGQNMGTKPVDHVCNESARLAHQQSKWKLEIDKNLETYVQDFLSSPQGQFHQWLVKNGRL